MKSSHNILNKYEFINNLKYADNDYYLFCIDIINFKSINDTFGYQMADALLDTICEYLSDLFTYKISICKIERDIILVKTDTVDLNYLLKTIDDLLSNEYFTSLKFRIGYQMCNTSNFNIFLENICKVIKYDKYIITDAITHNNDISLDIYKYDILKKELFIKSSDYFKLVYQPKISTKTNMVESCEVLSRWYHPQTKEMYPNEFLSIITTLDKEVDFDLMMFELACSEITNFSHIISDFSINLSTKSIASEDFADKLIYLTYIYSMKPHNITLEITENVDDHNFDTITSNISKLASHGFKISIDDFGTGYSSYFRLSKMEFSEVKIPKEFFSLGRETYNSKNKKILSGIVNLCKNLDSKVVIEGVETEDDLKIAKELEIDYIQGYYYSKPVDKYEYEKFVLNHNTCPIKTLI